MCVCVYVCVCMCIQMHEMVEDDLGFLGHHACHGHLANNRYPRCTRCPPLVSGMRGFEHGVVSRFSNGKFFFLTTFFLTSFCHDCRYVCLRLLVMLHGLVANKISFAVNYHGLRWPSAGPLLALCWLSAGPPLALHWCHKHDKTAGLSGQNSLEKTR
jgi:hypothetical protein